MGLVPVGMGPGAGLGSLALPPAGAAFLGLTGLFFPVAISTSSAVTRPNSPVPCVVMVVGMLSG